MEIWKDVVGYEGYYQVSSLGRIKSFVIYRNGKIRSVKCNGGGYIRLILMVGKVRKTVLLHRIVYEAFRGSIPVGMEIHHIDGNKQNNCISNLQCLSKMAHTAETNKANPHYADAMIRYNTITRAKKVEQWTLDGHLIATFPNFKIASQITGVCERNIGQVANGEEYKLGKRRKQAGGYIWKLAKS